MIGNNSSTQNVYNYQNIHKNSKLNTMKNITVFIAFVVMTLLMTINTATAGNHNGTKSRAYYHRHLNKIQNHRHQQQQKVHRHHCR